MPTPRVSKNNPDQDALGLSPITPPDDPAQSVNAEVVSDSEPQTIWIDEDQGLSFEVLPTGDRCFELPLSGHTFVVRPVTIGDVIDLEKSTGSIAELGLEAYARLLAQLTIESTFPFEGTLIDRVAQIKKQLPTEPDLSLASRALMHLSSEDLDAKAEGVEVEIEPIDGLPVKRVRLPRSGLVVRLRTELAQDSVLISKSMGGQQAFDSRPVEAFSLRVARLCLQWGDRNSITSSDVKALRFGADFHALNKALRFFRRTRRAG